jgi:protein-S-isoprenylcysteine O-methyltransferase Ste14
MLWFYEYFFPAIWIVFLVYWQIRAIGAKATQRLEPIGSRIVRSIVFLAAIALLMLQHIPLPWLYLQIFPQGLAAFWVGAAVTVAGLAFAVWARGYLGSNWSSSVTIKHDHQLIVSGPYALVRHPIYTGILTGFLGSAIALAQVRGVIALLLVALVLWAKLSMEEKWMREQFGATYDAYSRRVRALVPFIL